MTKGNNLESNNKQSSTNDYIHPQSADTCVRKRVEACSAKVRSIQLCVLLLLFPLQFCVTPGLIFSSVSSSSFQKRFSTIWPFGVVTNSPGARRVLS